MLDELLKNRKTIFLLRKVFARKMPYGTYLEINDAPASLQVIYKGKPIWSVTDQNGTPVLTTPLSNEARKDVENALASLLPVKETTNG